MRITFTRLAVFALVVVLIAGFGASRSVLAQDAMAAKVTCDSDLILSLYIAEYHFDFAAVEDKLMAADSSGAMMTTLDLASYDKGQFAPLFDAMMANMDSSMSTGMLDDATMTGVVTAMSMDQAMMETTPEAMDGAMMTELAPATITGEAPECTALRDELRHFYTALANSSAMMSESK